MLRLRSAIVVEAAGDALAREQRLVIELTGNGRGTRRSAIGDVGLVGRAEAGDEVIVNVQAAEEGLGSGGFDVVHVNLTRGLGVGPEPGATSVPGSADAASTLPARAMKLNYTSLQHGVDPVESPVRSRLGLPLQRPVGVLALHGQLAAVAWAYARAVPGARLGYVQTEGGALTGSHSRVVRELRERGLLAGHLTAGAAFGGEAEAVTTAGALHHGLGELGWDAALCGPGPGIVGSESSLGHGGMAALDSAHVALALGCQTLIVARMSSSDERRRHRGISHHTLTVLDLLLEPVSVALPAGTRSPVGAELRAGLGSVFAGSAHAGPALALDVERPARITRHDWRRATVDLPAYAGSGLPAQTMGRSIAQDALFFGAALAGGTVLAELAAEGGADETSAEAG